MRAIVASAPMPGGTRQSTSSSARAGITLIFSPAEMIVGATVTPSVGSNSAASRGSIARMRSTAPSASSGSSPIARRNARGSSVTSYGGAARAEPLERGRELEQRVVGGRGHGGVAGPAARADGEAERALLRAADAVQAAVAERHHGAGALVEQVVGAGEVRPVLAQPLGALDAAGLLVDDREDLQRAAGRAPAVAGQPRGGDRLGGRLGLHVERAAAPQEAVVDRARPRVVGPVLRRRRAPCRRARGSRAPARAPRPRAWRRGSGGRARCRRARTPGRPR